jgi:hypothetical protein
MRRMNSFPILVWFCLISIIALALAAPGFVAHAGELEGDPADEIVDDLVQPASTHWIIEAWPQAECSGWWVDFVGGTAIAEQWRVKVDGSIIASGSTRGNETVSGSWPASVDLNQAHSFSVEILESSGWQVRDEPDGFGPCPPGVCITIQRGRSGSVADTYTYRAYPNGNYGGYTVLYTGSLNEYAHHSLLSFDLSVIPSGVTLSEATLSLYMTESSSQSVNVHRITQMWGENTATWNSFASAYDSTVWGSFTASGAPKMVDVDLLNLVNAWRSNTFPNYGLLLNHPNYTGRDRYHSSEATDGVRLYRPKLEVCYELVLGDFVWNDLNANGVQDANEPGIDGLSVKLLNAEGSELASTTTANGGFYKFSVPAAGDYRVRFSVLPGYAFSPQGLGGNPATDSDADPSSGVTGLISMGAVYSDLRWDAGMFQAGRIGDTVYYDGNRNQIQDGEPGIAGVTINLFTDSTGSCDRLFATKQTDGLGKYLFDQLPAGHYCVSVSEDVVQNPSLGGLERTTSANPIVITLAAGQDRLDADFGYAGAGVIRGTVFFDTDSSTSQNPDEPGLPNVQVCLFTDADGNGQPDTPAVALECTTTDSSGGYQFDQLPPGGYVIVETPPNLPINTTPTVRATELEVTQGGGQSDNNDFGHTSTASYSISKVLLTPNANRPGQELQFELKVTNTGNSWITTLPLRDIYNPQYLAFVSANPAPADAVDDGQLDWPDLTQSLGHDLAPGESVAVLATFRGLADTGALAGGVTINRVTMLGSPADPDGPSGALGALLAVGSQSATAPVQLLSPTSSSAVSTATRVMIGADVELNWTTVSEVDLLGFNVLRSVDNGSFVVLNSEMIAAKVAGNNAGSGYQWIDVGGGANAVSVYRIEAVMSGGYTVIVDAAKATRVFMPVITR